MKSISVREFSRKPADYLEELPIKLTSYSKVVAIVCPPDEVTKKPKPKTTPKVSKSVRVCPHGIVRGVGICKSGCK